MSGEFDDSQPVKTTQMLSASVAAYLADTIKRGYTPAATAPATLERRGGAA